MDEVAFKVGFLIICRRKGLNILAIESRDIVLFLCPNRESVLVGDCLLYYDEEAEIPSMIQQKQDVRDETKNIVC
ncbi:MAG: hypothetical protein ISS41_10620 [Candidatus Aminicenantes bacterium]|nr:hypothetical protein [Candidatus Aminicenantes bacterium]MBL7084062.1 hypothetical protein [Candidatus Aminicenantes bacterium]